MSLYEHLAPVYDGLFPVDPATIDFLENLEGMAGSRVVDLGSATGGHAFALADLGWEVIALEPSPSLMRIARDRQGPVKQGLSQPNPLLVEQDLSHLSGQCLPGSVDLLLCLGNTLPHLKDGAAIGQFLASAALALDRRGILILQLVNYDLIGSGHIFPVIKNDVAKFSRSYAEGGYGRLSFETTLSLEDGTIWKDSTELYPLTPEELSTLILDSGFSTARQLSGWGGEAFDSAASPFLIVEARKQT
jgi:SAM-dependent methyltransferase